MTTRRWRPRGGYGAPPCPPEFFFLLRRPPPRSTLFPYTTLFRSIADGARNTRVSAHSPPVCFVFSGQGTQWSGMALGLREADRTFAAELQRIDEAFAAAGSIRPIEELERGGPTSRLERTDVAQVCLFAVPAALLNVLEQRGIRPSVVMGHSAGELAAAYAAGMLTLEAAVQAVLARSTAMQSAFDT